MQSGSGTPPIGNGGVESRSGLDVQAAATLGRLTRWAAKALQAAIAVVTVVDGDHDVVASATGNGASEYGERLLEFAARIVSSGQPQQTADARPRPTAEDADPAGAAFLGAPLRDRNGTVVGSFCVMDTRPRDWTDQDVELVGELATSAMTELDLLATRAETERERRWSDRQQAVLELIAARAPLSRTLTALLEAVEAHSPAMLTSIQLLERERGQPDRLRNVAAPRLPRAFVAATDVLAIGEGRGVCGTAAHRGEPVVAADLATDLLTADFADVAAAHGLRACWSTPIRSGAGDLLGTFAVYYREARSPDRDHRLIVERSTHIARLAIEQAHDARALRRNATRAQSLAREQTALQRVATRVAGETDPQVLFALVAEQVGRLLRADAGYVLRFEDEERYRNMGFWTRGGESPLPVDTVVRYSTEGEPARLPSRRSAKRCAVEPGSDVLGLRHRIAAPVIVDGTVWGTVVALRDASGFARDDEKRLVRFAQLSSVAVSNANAHEALDRQARTDSLTGLANRRAFDERLAEETERAQRHTRALSVMLVDVDNFKTINDRFGHATGDRVLVNLADSLRAVMRSGDLLARIGGDEMALILPDCRSEKAAVVAQRMLDAIGSGASLARRHGATLSAGVAGLSAGQSADDLLRCADQALYGAKDEGRNQVVVYDAAMPGRQGMRLSA